MGLLSSLTPWDSDTYGNKEITLRVLVECEKGSTNKCEYDDEAGAMVIVRQLDEHYPYPYAYGCIPQTLAEDGDALDAIVISDEVIHSGTVINCKPLAVIKMIDNGDEDDKLLCVPFYKKTGQIDVLNIVKYLKTYKYPYQEGTFLTGFEDVKQAVLLVQQAHEAYLRSKK